MDVNRRAAGLPLEARAAVPGVLMGGRVYGTLTDPAACQSEFKVLLRAAR
ncbi:hypothetical protein SBA4_5580017 [Candidatus Sulfopaludibacter sp. SbA4]|nr:hypothetical protein SBA4_5580017 [Candidatus Sulfopaludibacter sp. SbA4]